MKPQVVVLYEDICILWQSTPKLGHKWMLSTSMRKNLQENISLPSREDNYSLDKKLESQQ